MNSKLLVNEAPLKCTGPNEHSREKAIPHINCCPLTHVQLTKVLSFFEYEPSMLEDQAFLWKSIVFL